MERVLNIGKVIFVLAVMPLGQVAVGAPIEFNRQVRPILANYCFECHGPDAESRKGHLRLDTFSGATTSAIVPGNPDESPLLERVHSPDEDERMPPSESPRQPKAEHLEILRQWIVEGATYDEHWAFRPIARPNLDKVSEANAIDSIVASHLKSKGLTLQSSASPTVLARRLSLALTGLPALPEKLRQFEARFEKDSRSAIDQWVDGLLMSEAYGEHFAWTWMDAARYSDTNGYQGDGPRVMWPWRDWLIDALNANLPFDKLTMQMLAGDLLLPETLASWETGDWIPDKHASSLVTATGFLRNHRYDSGSGTIAQEAKFVNATDRLETVGTVWLGLTMQCARCHTHKFDPIEQREYYAMLSFFDNVPEVGEGLKQASHPYIHTPLPDQRAKLLKLQRAHQDAVAAFCDAEELIAEKQRGWESSKHPKRSARVLRSMQYRYAEKPLGFDGTMSVKKDNEPIKLCVGSRPWSISFWFRADDEGDCAIFSSVQEPERYRQGIQADWVGRKIRLRHVSRWVNSSIEFESVDTLPSNTWHHVTLRCDGRIQGLAYQASLNGSDAAMICTHEVANNSADRPGKAPLVLGDSPFLPKFRGQLRDLRFYDRDLERSEVASLADPRSTSELIQTRLADRSDSVNDILRGAYLESDALPEEIASLRNAVHETKAAFTKALKETPTTMVMKDVDLGATRLHAMGAYDRPTEPVDPDTPSILPPLGRETSPTRLDFAKWLMRPDHPLTARVAVNRIWQVLWGNGLVDSPENFGTQCAEPEHAVLLDWLASEYMRLGWDTKAVVKLIVTSRTYCQDSAAPASLWKRDPDNRLLARGPRFRLPVHAVRDQALVFSGRLDPKVGGPPVLLDEVLGKDEKPIKLDFDRSDRRRTLYTLWKRNAPHPMLAVFDVADRNQCDVRAHRTNTPLQALVTLNEPGLAACARDLAKRAASRGESDEERLHWMWLACTGQVPNAAQVNRLADALTRYRKLTPDDPHQAWMAVANVVLNLDATLTLE